MSFAIIVCWLTATGWLLWNDVWPDWQPGQPPPFTIDLEEEAEIGHAQVRWVVSRNALELLTARTWVEYREKPDDTFALKLNLKPKGQDGSVAIGGLARLKEMDSTYRLSRKGEVREVAVNARYEAALQGVPLEVKFDLQGEVRDGEFRPRLRYESRTVSELKGEWSLPAVRVSHHGSMLLPLHPVHRIEGLRRGQSWAMPLVNVLEASTSLQSTDPVVWLQARVLPDTKPLIVDHKEYDCLIIEYRGDGHRASTWVDEKTGLVLRQEQSIGGDQWRMQRETGPAR